jgi:hypothetical protein
MKRFYGGIIKGNIIMLSWWGDIFLYDNYWEPFIKGFMKGFYGGIIKGNIITFSWIVKYISLWQFFEWYYSIMCYIIIWGLLPQ